MISRFVLCMGGCVIDRVGETAEAAERLRTSNIGRMRSSLGGVARNVAENLARLGVRVRLCSLIGDDLEGERLLAESRNAGIDISAVERLAAGVTASYTAIFNGEGELVIGLADMAIFEAVTPEQAERAIAAAPADAFIFIDANLPPPVLAAVARAKGAHLLAAVPVSIQKLRRLVPILGSLDLLFLNLHEARALIGHVGGAEDLALALSRSPVSRGLLTLGPAGALAWEAGIVTRIPALPSSPVNVNGAGDALAGATLARLAFGDGFVSAARRAMAAAALTVETAHTVRPDLSMASMLARHVLSSSIEKQPS